jgi:hypothetical protein
MTWQLWCGGTRETCASWQIFTIHPVEAVITINTGTRKSRQLWRIITVIWGMLTVQIGCPLATRLAVERESEQRRIPPIKSGYSQQLVLLSACGGNKISHSDFRLTLTWEMPVRAGNKPRPSMLVGKPAQLLLTSGDWTHVKIITGLTAIPRNGSVPCVQQGSWREQWCSNVSSVTWFFVWTEIVLRITTQRTIYKTYFRPLSAKTVEASTTIKEHRYLQVFRNLSFSLRNKEITPF